LPGVNKGEIAMQKIKVGDKVTWVCNPYMGKLINVSGIVIKIFQTKFGGKALKKGARISVDINYPFNRSTTVVALDKLTLMEAPCKS
jgi:hypothetical protein